LHRPPAACLVAVATGFHRWPGEPLAPGLRERFSIGPVVAVKLLEDEVSGRLLFLDKPRMTADDLVLGGIVAHQLASRIRALCLARRLEEDRALEERLRLARDLHDGAFHSLTGISLEVERLLRMPEFDAGHARNSLNQIQLSIQDEQRTLRMLIDGLRTASIEAWAVNAGLETRLKDLAGRVERQWGVTVGVDATDLGGVPVNRWSDLCLIVQEALVNVGRHARASACNLELRVHEGTVSIVVDDNGRGFPFKGHYDHQQLVRLRIGPSTLRERAI